MAAPRLISVRDFNTSRFAQLADTVDVNLSDALARAEKAIESRLKRPIAPTTFIEFYRPTSSTIYLRRRPVISITSITSGFTEAAAEANTTSLPNVYLDAEQGILNTGRSYTGFVLRVEYLAGFEETPEDIKEAIILQTALFISPDMEIYGTGDSKPPGILYYKKDIAELLEPYKQLHIAYTPT